MKSFQLEIPIDPHVDSVIQPMRKKLDELVELLDLEIIVRAELMGFAHRVRNKTFRTVCRYAPGLYCCEESTSPYSNHG